MVKQWPHSGTLTYLADGTYSNGIYIDGASTSKTIEQCNIQPRGGLADYVIGPDGDRIKINYVIYTPRFSGDDDIPTQGLTFSFNGNEYLVLEYWVYQKRVRIKC